MEVPHPALCRGSVGYFQSSPQQVPGMLVSAWRSRKFLGGCIYHFHRTVDLPFRVVEPVYTLHQQRRGAWFSTSQSILSSLPFFVNPVGKQRHMTISLTACDQVWSGWGMSSVRSILCVEWVLTSGAGDGGGPGLGPARVRVTGGNSEARDLLSAHGCPWAGSWAGVMRSCSKKGSPGLPARVPGRLRVCLLFCPSSHCHLEDGWVPIRPWLRWYLLRAFLAYPV